MAKLTANGKHKVASVSYTTKPRTEMPNGGSEEHYTTFALRSDGAVLEAHTSVYRHKSDGGKYPHRMGGNYTIVGTLRTGLPITEETLRNLRVVKAYSNKYNER